MKFCYTCFWLLLLTLPCRINATTIIPFKHLGEATQASDAVVLATAVKSFESTSGNLVLFDCSFHVRQVVKGNLTPGANITLRQHSRRLDEYSVDIAGDFVPVDGKTYLLFLHRVGDVWRPISLAYYVFETKEMNDDEYLVPAEEGLGISLFPRADGTIPELPAVYHSREMLQLLTNYVDGTQTAWNASAAQTNLLPNDFPQDRALPVGCDFALGASLSRWQNANVEIYFDDTNAPSGFSGTLDAILGSMNSNYTGIDPVNGGETSFTPDCSDNSVLGNDFTAFLAGLNGNQTTLLFFDDPCNQIADLSGCNGTLAIGGSFSSSSTHTYKGDVWNNALWGFIIVNNGAPDCLTQAQYEIMLTHEMTHTYRMDHLNATNYPSQNMNPVCCNIINTKDIECMNYTYDLVSPVELKTFNAQATEQHQVRISWATASEKNNHHFEVERSTDGYRFEKVKTIDGKNTQQGSSYEWVDALPFGGVNYYRLSQVDDDGHTTVFGIRAVTLDEGNPAFRVYPNPASTAEINVVIDLPASFNGTLEILNPAGHILSARELSLERGRTEARLSVDHLSSGFYWLRIREAGSAHVIKFFKN